MSEQYTLAADRVMAVKLHDANLRAARAEHALATRNLAEAESTMKQLQASLEAEISEDGQYEIASSVDLTTGRVARVRRVPPDPMATP